MKYSDTLRDLRVAPAPLRQLDRAEQQRYAEDHDAIYAAALRQIDAWRPNDRPLRVLELGGAPYYFTALLLLRGCEVTCVGVPGQVWPGEMTGVEQTSVTLGLGRRSWQIPVCLMNVEREPLPFPDGSFDVVLCMDILQHLGYHPTLMFCEAHRVLKASGKLLIGVPNGLSLRRLLWLLAGIVDTDRFAARGMYHRRQRSSAPDEVRALAAGCGFRIEQSRLLNLQALPPAGWPRRLAALARWLTTAPIEALRRRRDYLLLVATPAGRRRAAYPPGLYHYVRLYPRIPGAADTGE